VLLEREEPLAALESALARAREGRGHTLLVGALGHQIGSAVGALGAASCSINSYAGLGWSSCRDRRGRDVGRHQAQTRLAT
jgi:hypothetical protein